MADELPEGTDSDGTEGVAQSDDGNKAVPYQRFKQVNDTLAAYKELGSPDDVAADLVAYRQLQQAVASGALDSPAPQDTPKPVEPSENDARILKKLQELIPGIGKLGDMEAAIRALDNNTKAMQSQTVEQLQAQATTWVQGKLVDDGYIPENPSSEESENTKKLAKQLEDLVANRVYQDDKLRKRFLSGDLQVVQEAYSEVDKLLGNKFQKTPKRKVPSMFGTANGQPSMSEFSKSKYSEADLAKMEPKQRKKALNDEAFRMYHELAEARQEG